MSISKTKKRIAIYYDGNYIGKVAKYYASNNIVSYRFNISVLHNYIIAQTEKLAAELLAEVAVAEAISFRTRRLTHEFHSRKNHLYWERVSEDNLLELNIDSKFSLSTSDSVSDDSVVCSSLSLELYDTVISKNIDMAVIVGGSSSYLPLVNKLTSRGVDVMVVGWDIVKSDEAEHEANCYHKLFEAANYPIVVNSVLDDTPEELAGLLKEVEAAKPQFEREDSGVESNNSGIADESIAVEIGEWSVSEVVTLKPNFGFIRYTGNNLFFHSADYDGDFTELKVGEGVEFTLEKSDDGQFIARNVSKVTSNLHLFEDDDYTVSEEFFDWEK